MVNKQINIRNKMKQIIILSIIFYLASCTAKVADYSDPTDNLAPSPVRNVKVENLNGGAVIKYTLPGDKDLMGVKAVYSFDANDEMREVYASAFCDSIFLDGYADTDEHTVELFAVDESGNLSTPTQVTIRPLTPPIELIRQSLTVSATFGGVYAKWDNPLMKNMDIALFVTDSTGEQVIFDRFFSSSPNGTYTFRQFDSIPQSFHLELRDRWNHFSVPLDTVLTPLFETQIKGRDERGNDIWKLLGEADLTDKLRGDVFPPFVQLFRYVHDGVLLENSYYWYTQPKTLNDFYPGSSTAALYPQYFTIDMGRKAVYSRWKYYSRNRSPVYSAWVWYELELWGTNNPKSVTEVGDGGVLDNLRYWTCWEGIDGTDAWKNDWEKLCDCVVNFPSGTPNTVTQVTSAEDIAFVRGGFEFPVDTEMTTKAYRYLRVVLKKQNLSPTYIQIGEIEFYGAYED
jgi:hypothetical protein